VRKKFLLESLQQSVHALQGENDQLRLAIREHLTDEAETLLAPRDSTASSVIATDSRFYYTSYVSILLMYVLIINKEVLREHLTIQIIVLLKLCSWHSKTL